MISSLDIENAILPVAQIEGRVEMYKMCRDQPVPSLSSLGCNFEEYFLGLLGACLKVWATCNLN
jgi:hypothetical protein